MSPELASKTAGLLRESAKVVREYRERYLEKCAEQHADAPARFVIDLTKLKEHKGNG